MNDRRIAIALFVLAFGAYVYFYGGWGANQEVNYALTRAMVEARTFAVDDFTVHEGDIANGRGGHIYSNKPPGLPALAAVPYAFQYALQQRRIVRFRDYWRTNKQLVTIEICGIAGALIPPILFLYGRRVLGVSAWSAALVALMIAFGTIVFPYSTMLFAHVPSALFLLLAFVLLRTRPFLAGVAAGIAGMCFLIAGVAALILVILSRRSATKDLEIAGGFAFRDPSPSSRLRMTGLFIAGGAPFAIALAIYQWICFGSPFVTSLERSGYSQQGLVLGFFGKPTHFFDLLVPEYRGLFFTSPILLFALIGFVFIWRRFRADAIAILAITLVFLLSIASFNGWHGGAAFGPRYLVPIIPLLGIPMMFAAHRWRAEWLVLGAISIAINLAATAVDPMPIDGMEHPLSGYILRAPHLSLAQDSGNLGGSVLPAILWIVAGSAWILKRATSLDRTLSPSRDARAATESQTARPA
jgi:hypothetical protein